MYKRRVNNDGLKGEVQRGEGDGGGVGADGLAQQQPCIGIGHSQVDAVQVFGGGDGLVLRQGDLTGAQLPSPQA